MVRTGSGSMRPSLYRRTSSPASRWAVDTTVADPVPSGPPPGGGQEARLAVIGDHERRRVPAGRIPECADLRIERDQSERRGMQARCPSRESVRFR